MNEKQEMALIEQRELIRPALKAFTEGYEQTNVRSARLNGDVLWMEERGHFWLGVTVVAEAKVGVVIVKNGEIQEQDVMENVQHKHVFIRVFPELAEFDRRTESGHPKAVYGVRIADDLNEVHGYYEMP